MSTGSPDTSSQLLTSKYLTTCRDGCLYVMRQRLSNLVRKEQVVLVKTPGWRSWWKSLNDPQRGSSFAPPFVLVRFQEYALADHQNTTTMLKAGVIFKKNDQQVTDVALFSMRVGGQIQIIHRDSEAQVHLAVTMLTYLQGGAFNFSVAFPGLPAPSTCTVATEEKSVTINDGLAIEDTEAGDVSAISLSFYGLFWNAIEQTGPRLMTVDSKILQQPRPPETELTLVSSGKWVQPPSQ